MEGSRTNIGWRLAPSSWPVDSRFSSRVDWMTFPKRIVSGSRRMTGSRNENGQYNGAPSLRLPGSGSLHRLTVFLIVFQKWMVRWCTRLLFDHPPIPPPNDRGIASFASIHRTIFSKIGATFQLNRHLINLDAINFFGNFSRIFK